jgi:hypothetical protein
VLLFQMVTFRYPFEAPTLPALALKIVACDHCPLPEETPADLRELIATLLSRSQITRPNVRAEQADPVSLATFSVPRLPSSLASPLALLCPRSCLYPCPAVCQRNGPAVVSAHRVRFADGAGDAATDRCEEEKPLRE